jgi:hypothetical protein
MLVYLYAGLALAGAALVAYQAAGELRRQR